jgi:4,5-DOPA dioxygenase extradiol
MKQAPDQSAHTMPVLFVGHGSPMNLIQDNAFTRFLKLEGRSLPRPSAILVISAHWETSGTKVLAVEKPKTIHDFSGFPRELYEINYAAPGSPEFAQKTLDALRAYDAAADTSWGLDHGSWAVLHHMFPRAEIPVFQLSLNRRLPMAAHLELAKSLRPLREQGVLILASGNITHNLGEIDWNCDAPVMSWAQDFDECIKAALLDRDPYRLTAQDPQMAKLWRQAHPRADHYVPLLYALGATDAHERPVFAHESFQHGSLSMRAVRFG